MIRRRRRCLRDEERRNNGRLSKRSSITNISHEDMWINGSIIGIRSAVNWQDDVSVINRSKHRRALTNRGGLAEIRS